jgi:two-component system response regulator LytT
MAKINILVVENQPIASSDLYSSLKNLGYNIIGTYNTGERAVEKAGIDSPDVVLIDIRLKGKMNGIEAANRIRLNYSIPVIFYTSDTDKNTFYKAKKTKPYGYLLKPVKDVDLYSMIEVTVYKHNKDKEELLLSVMANQKNANEFVFVKHNGKLVKIYIYEIIYIEALKDYVVIHTSDTRYTINSTMKDIGLKIGNETLLRVHRSYIVNLNKITTIEYPFLTLEKTEKNIPIGGSYKSYFNKHIKII